MKNFIIFLFLLVSASRLNAQYFNYLPLSGKKITAAVENGDATALLKQKGQNMTALSLYYFYGYPNEVFLKLNKKKITNKYDIIALSFIPKSLNSVNIEVKFAADNLVMVYWNIYNAKYTAAMKNAGAFAGTNPAFFRFLISYIYFQKKDLNKSFIWLKQALKKDPTNIFYNLLLSEIYFFSSDYANSDKILNNILRRSPKNTTALFLALKSAENEKNDTLLIRLFKANIKKTSDKSVIFHFLGEHYMAEGNYGEAQKYLKKALAAGNYFFQSYAYITAATKNNDGKGIKKFAEKLIKDKRELPYFSSFALAAALVPLDKSAAIFFYKAALAEAPAAKGPMEQKIYNNFISFLMDSGNYPELYKISKQAAIQFPQNEDFFYSAAFASQNLDYTDRAVFYYRKALRLSPQDYVGLTNLFYMLNSNDSYSAVIDYGKEYYDKGLSKSNFLYQYGFANFKGKKFIRAKEVFTKLYKINPAANYAKWLIKTLLKLKESSAAMTLAKKEFSQTNDADFAYFAARASQNLGSSRDAIYWFRKASEEKPFLYTKIFFSYLLIIKNNALLSDFVDSYQRLYGAKPDIFYNLSRAYELMHDYKKSLKFINKSIASAPLNQKYFSQKLDILIASKDIRATLTYAKKILKKMPDNADLVFKIAQMYELLKQYSSAEKWYVKAIKSNEKNNYYNALIDMMIRLGKDKATLAYLNLGLKHSPSSAYLFYKGSIIYTKLKNSKRAINYLRKSIALSPSTFKYYISLLDLYTSLNNFKAAAQFAAQAVKMFPENTQLLMKAGYINRRLNNDTSALNYYSKAIEITPDNPKYIEQKIALLIEMKNYKRAVLECNKTIVKFPDFSTFYFDMGLSYQWLSGYDTAESYYKKALSIDEKPVYYISLLQLYLIQKQYKKVIKLKKNLLTIAPNNYTIYVKLGLAYKGLNEYSKAEINLNKAIKLNNKAIPAYSALAQIYFLRNENAAAFKLYNKTISLSRREKIFIAPEIFKGAYESAIAENYLETGVFYIKKYLRAGKEDEKVLNDFAFYSIKLKKINAGVQFLFYLLQSHSTNFSNYYKSLIKDNILDLKNYYKEQQFLAIVKQKYRRIYTLAKILKRENRQSLIGAPVMAKGHLIDSIDNLYILEESGNLKCALKFKTHPAAQKGSLILIVGKYKALHNTKNKEGISAQYPLISVSKFLLFK